MVRLGSGCIEMQMWRDLVKAFSTKSDFHPPAGRPRIMAVEAALQHPIPKELSDLLCESNGIEGEYGLGLIWSVERLEKENLQFRTNSNFKDLYMPFHCLLFFADAGNGDQFAFAVCNGKIQRPDVFVWNHENESRMWIAPSLRSYLEWWLTGKIKI